MTHVVADITGHGYGHAAQLALLINALHARDPSFSFTVRTTLPATFLRARITPPFALIAEALDVGMLMHDSMDVKVEASARWYRNFHADWPARVADAAFALKRLKPHVLLANVPYLSLAAAARIGVPSVALCSLNWADIYRHYCGTEDGATAIHADMLAAYRSATMFLRPEPSMPMPDLRNTRGIPPLARVGRADRAALRATTSAGAGRRHVLVMLGGIPTDAGFARWPSRPDVHWIVPDAWCGARDDATGIDATGFQFIDLLASCDALITKPGYGMVVEAVCNRIPVLYACRGDWPEEANLVAWLERHGRARDITRAQLRTGDVAAELAALLACPAPEPPPHDGAEAAAALLADL